jgi:hypothetical protein
VPDNFACPNGHASEWADFCSQCGDAGASPPASPSPAAPAAASAAVPPTAAPVDAPAPVSSGAPPAVTNTGTCPTCHAPCEITDLFCEACGADLTTTDIARAGVAAVGVVVPPGGVSIAIGADREYFDRYVDGGQLVFPEPAPGVVHVPVTKPELLIGRRSESRGVFPDIDGQALTQDPAVSHKHALLKRDAAGAWTVIDQGSTNGSRLDAATELLIPGRSYALGPGSVLHVGAWTSISVVDDTASEAP